MTQIAIQLPAQTLSVPSHALLAILASAEQFTPQAVAFDLPAAIGAELQGGIYAGPAIEDGKLIHLIAAPECLGEHEWGDAKTAASEYRGGGFDDWELPSKAWLQIAQANGLKLPKAWHWTSTPYGELNAWAVGFENGLVDISRRNSELLARPFRRLSL